MMFVRGFMLVRMVMRVAVLGGVVMFTFVPMDVRVIFVRGMHTQFLVGRILLRKHVNLGRGQPPANYFARFDTRADIERRRRLRK